VSRTLSKKLKLKTINALTGWDAAIYDAEKSIEAAETRVDSLKMSIYQFRQFKKDGLVFPGDTPKTKRTKRQGKP
jgi:hypothetical protein